MRLLLVALVAAGIFTGCTTTNPATTAPPSSAPTVTPSPTLNQSQGGNYILQRWQRRGSFHHQCVGSGL